jgi:hypothetical protein
MKVEEVIFENYDFHLPSSSSNLKENIVQP